MPAPRPKSLPQDQRFFISISGYSIEGYGLSSIDTPTGSVPVDSHSRTGKLPIPKGSNGWVGAVLFKNEYPEVTGRFCVLLGFTPDLGVSIRIVTSIQNQDSKDLFGRYDPREPSVLEGFLVQETGSRSGNPYRARRRLYINLLLRWEAGMKVYEVETAME